MKYTVLFGRILLSLIFLIAAPGHFSAGTIQYAASHGVPLPSVLVPISGVLALLGGLSVLLGFKARWGAVLLLLFLVPVTLVMHNFWAVHDPAMAQMQKVNFLKNLAMMGGSLLVFYFGSGPVSLDAWWETRHGLMSAQAMKA